MKRRKLFGLAAGAAATPLAAVAAPMVEMHANDVTPVTASDRLLANFDWAGRYRAEFIAAFEERDVSVRAGDTVVVDGRPWLVTETFTAEGKDNA